MFISRKELKKQLWEARSCLAQEKENTRVSAFIEKSALPKCKSYACISCKHIVVQRLEGVGTFVLGCGKDNPCKEYERADNPAPRSAMLEHLAEQRG